MGVTVPRPRSEDEIVAVCNELVGMFTARQDEEVYW